MRKTTESANTPGPIVPTYYVRHPDGSYSIAEPQPSIEQIAANVRLIDAAPDLLAALHEGRRAIGDHFAPNDCYATGPLTGSAFRDLMQCPACSFIAMYEAAIAKATA